MSDQSNTSVLDQIIAGISQWLTDKGIPHEHRHYRDGSGSYIAIFYEFDDYKVEIWRDKETITGKRFKAIWKEGRPHGFDPSNPRFFDFLDKTLTRLMR